MDSSTCEIPVRGRRLTLACAHESHVRAFLNTDWDNHPLLPLAEAVPSGATYLDIGANIGVTVLAVATVRPDLRIIAFEPVPSNAAFLRRNLEANGIANCTVVEAALGDARSQISITNNGPWSLVMPGSDGALSVPVTTLDEYSERNLHDDRIDLIKLDVEGYEPNVLAGAIQVMRRFRPTFFMEFNAWTLVLQGYNPATFSRYLLESFDIGPIPGVSQNDPFSLAREIMVCHHSLLDVTMKPHADVLPLSAAEVKLGSPYKKPTHEIGVTASATRRGILSPLRGLKDSLRRRH